MPFGQQRGIGIGIFSNFFRVAIRVQGAVQTQLLVQFCRIAWSIGRLGGWSSFPEARLQRLLGPAFGKLRAFSEADGAGPATHFLYLSLL